ncbi:hypothetical protein COB55_05985 [Candidatus Wolfebacteria bacterium]|nr:MAG: hypothetical protein COB55_05985 [Candidatus Wolfebacteria bacterium]
MTRKTEIIKELNVIFEKRGWKLLSEDNYHHTIKHSIVHISNTTQIVLDRDSMDYKKHIDKYTLGQLDKYVMEYLNPTCKRLNLDSVFFYQWGERRNNEINSDCIDVL